MKKIFLLVTTFVVLMLFASLTFATNYVTINDGDVSSTSTWSGGIVPSSFGGSGNKETTITINHRVFYDADFTVPNNSTFTISSGAILNTNNFTLNGNNKTLIINGILISDGTCNVQTNSFSGSGTIIATSIQATIPSGITTFTGTNFWNGSINSDWSDSGNWSLGTKPSISDWASIGISPLNWPVISTSELIRGLFIGPSLQLTIGPNGSLQMDTIYTYGSLYIQSDETGTGNVYSDEAFGDNGNVEIQRYIADNKWHIISSPAIESLGDFYTNNSSIIRDNGTYLAFGHYDEMINNWSLCNIEAQPGDFGIGKGYILSTQAGSIVTFTGENIIVGPVTASVTIDSFGWNALGNPYTSALQITGTNSFLETNSSFLASGYEGVYIWDPIAGGTGDYVIIANDGYTFPGQGGETQLNLDQITVGQGFIVKVAEAGYLTFSSFMERPNAATLFKSIPMLSPALRLTAKSGDFMNRTIVGFRKDMTFGLDDGNDLGKLKGNPDIALYTQLVDNSSDIDFAIQTLPYQSFESLSIPVGLDLLNGGETTFTIETVNFPVGVQVYLEDVELNTLTQLNTEGASYTVNLPVINGYGRFNLVITNFTVNQTATNIEKQDQPQFNVSTINNWIIVNGLTNRNIQISVYSIDGKIWYQNYTEFSNQNKIDTSSFPSGIYLVKIVHSGKSQTSKVIVTKK